MKPTAKNKTKRVRLTPFRILLLGYIIVIAAGTVLLILPFSTRADGCATFMEALFTSVSASCVTGLTLQDTWTYWTPFGQAVILVLIQIGGIGFMTVIFSLFLMSGKKIGIKELTFMKEATNLPNLGGMVRLIVTILTGTLIFELAGAFLLCFRFVPDFGWGRGIWTAVFISVSAFCNAGFDIIGGNVSLTAYSSDPLICIVVPLLIIVGGLGFFVWNDLRNNKFSFKKYTLHTKLVLAATGIILVASTLLVFLSESDLPLGERILSSFFTAVTARTAGFSVINLTKPATIIIMMALMLVGGASGSTAGGIKINTVSVLFLSMTSMFRRKHAPQAFGRRIDQENVRTASQFVTMYILLIVFATILIAFFECNSGFGLTEILFETISAMGTVGISLGITQNLSVGSEIVLCILMFLGRAGCMTVMLSWRTPAPPAAELPVEQVRIA